MLSLRYYLEKMKTSSDVISKTYFINDNGEFYTGDDNIIPSLLIKINLYNLHKCIGKTVYVEYQAISSFIIPTEFKPYYKTKIVDIINWKGNDYIKFGSVSNGNEEFFYYMRLSTVPIVLMFSET